MKGPSCRDALNSKWQKKVCSYRVIISHPPHFSSLALSLLSLDETVVAPRYVAQWSFISSSYIYKEKPRVSFISSPCILVRRPPSTQFSGKSRRVVFFLFPFFFLYGIRIVLSIFIPRWLLPFEIYICITEKKKQYHIVDKVKLYTNRHRMLK